MTRPPVVMAPWRVAWKSKYPSAVLYSTPAASKSALSMSAASSAHRPGHSDWSAGLPSSHFFKLGTKSGAMGRMANELMEDGTPRQYLKVDNGLGMGRRGGAAGDWDADSPDV